MGRQKVRENIHVVTFSGKHWVEMIDELNKLRCFKDSNNSELVKKHVFGRWFYHNVKLVNGKSQRDLLLEAASKEGLDPKEHDAIFNLLWNKFNSKGYSSLENLSEYR